MYDRSAEVVGLRAVPEDTPHAYPIRPVGKGATYVISARTFFAFYDIPLGTPVRRDVKTVDGDILVIDLRDPGRGVISNRNRAEARSAQESGEG